MCKAADALDRAPSAVSRRIKDLEARLQTQLLTRTIRKIALTGAGERLLERARQVLTDLEEAEGLAAADAQSVTGELRLTMPLSFGLAHLAPAISDFMIENISVRIDSDLNDKAPDLAGDRLDLAIRIGKLPDSSLRARHLAPIRHVVAASPEFWNMHGIPGTSAKFSRLPALFYSNLPTTHVRAWSNARG